MLGNLNDQLPTIFSGDLNGVIDFRKSALGEFNIQNGTDDLSDLTNVILCHLISPCHNLNSPAPSLSFNGIGACNDLRQLLSYGALSCTVVL